jgi:hypothetical protein
MENVLSLENITIAPGVRETASVDGAVLLDINQGICFSLNPVGLKIWEMLKQHYGLEQMLDSLECDFHVPRAELALDIRNFVGELESKHLISHGACDSAKRGWLARLLA